MSSNPLLTIVVTSYNYGKYLPRALDSVLASRFPSFEILLIEDGSTDNSLEIAKKYAEKDGRIRLIDHQSNRGIFYSIEESIQEAKGLYYHQMSADDFRLPGYIEKSMQILIEHPQAGLCFSDCGHIMDEEEKIRRGRLVYGVERPTYFSPEQLIGFFQKTSIWIPGHTAIVKKQSILKYGKYNPRLKSRCDWFLLHQIALNEGAAYIPETLSVWWLHSNSYSSDKNKQEFRALNKTQLEILFQKEYKQSRKLFMKSALFRSVFDDLFFTLFYNPKYWGFFFYFLKKSAYWHFSNVIKLFKRKENQAAEEYL